MNINIPQYDIDFTKEGQDHFFLYSKDRKEPSRPANNSPHRHNYYCLSFLYEGQVPDFVDVTYELIHAPALLILNVEQIHIHTDLKDCKMISMAFSPEFLYGQDKKLRSHTEIVFTQTSLKFSDGVMEDLDQYIKLIIQNYKMPDKDPEVIKCLLNILLIKCAKLIEHFDLKDAGNKDVFKDFQRLLKKHFRNNHQVKFYADALNIAPAVLTQTVKNAGCKTPKEMIDQRLISEAKRLLYWSDVTVKEIAWELGFETDSYFNKFFKKFTGKTPQAFWREML